MVYLDNMGHLFSDVGIEELYEFAVVKMKLKPEWNHYSRHFPHFDLTTNSKKSQAIKFGAKPIDAGEEEWTKVTDEMKTTFKQDLPKYLSTGLYGQKIFRVDFKSIGLSTM